MFDNHVNSELALVYIKLFNRQVSEVILPLKIYNNKPFSWAASINTEKIKTSEVNNLNKFPINVLEFGAKFSLFNGNSNYVVP